MQRGKIFLSNSDLTVFIENIKIKVIMPSFLDSVQLANKTLITK